MAVVEKRYLDKICYVDGSFVYECDLLVGALDDLYVHKKINLVLRPSLKQWLIGKGLIRKDNQGMGGYILLDADACMKLGREVEQCSDVYLANTLKQSDPTEGGYYLCIVRYLNDGGWFSQHWALLSWYHTAEKGDCWNLEGFDGGTQVLHWRKLPDYPDGI